MIEIILPPEELFKKASATIGDRSKIKSGDMEIDNHIVTLARYRIAIIYLRAKI